MLPAHQPDSSEQLRPTSTCVAAVNVDSSEREVALIAELAFGKAALRVSRVARWAPSALRYSSSLHRSRSGGRRAGVKDFLVLQEMLRSWRATLWTRRSIRVAMR